MSDSEKELEARLAELPDADPGFMRSTVFLFKTHGLVDEAIRLIEGTPGITTDEVIEFRLEYCGDLEFYDDDGIRIPVDPARLRLTRGMRAILAEMRGKTLKSYQYAPVEAGGDVADCNVRLNLGQHAVDLNCYEFAFDVSGEAVGLGAWHCERMSLRDDFRPWSNAPVRAYAVGERITGVELVTDHAEVLRGSDAGVLDVDVAVVVRTAHAAYTFARESWRSTGIRAAMADRIAVPYEPGEVDAAWLGLPEDGAAVGEVSRTVERLA